MIATSAGMLPRVTFLARLLLLLLLQQINRAPRREMFSMSDTRFAAKVLAGLFGCIALLGSLSFLTFLVMEPTDNEPTKVPHNAAAEKQGAP